ADKLDSLLARVGELMLAQRRIESRVSDLGALQELVASWKTEWKKVEPLVARERTETTNGGVTLTVKAARPLPRRALMTLRQTSENLRRLEKGLERLHTTMTRD